MVGSQKQIRNPENVRLLSSDFITRREFFLDGARLSSAVLATHAAGGGNLMYGWMADSCQNHGRGYLTAWTELNVAPADYAASTNGGPYVNFDGATEALYINDAAWQEAGTEELFVWHWCNPAAVAAVMAVASKFDANGNNRSWALVYSNAVPGFIFYTDATGLLGGLVAVQSTYGAATVDTWYFVAGYWQASTLQRVYVGAATDDTLTIDSLAVGVPASVFNGSAPLAIGTLFNAAPVLSNVWDGLIGVGGARLNVPATNINAYAQRLFALTQRIYR